MCKRTKVSKWFLMAGVFVGLVFLLQTNMLSAEERTKPENLLKNPSFEEEEDFLNQPGWSMNHRSGAGSTFQRLNVGSADAHDGDYVGEIQYRQDGGEGWAQAIIGQSNEPVDAKDGDYFVCSIWHRIADADGPNLSGTLSMSLRVYDKENVYIGEVDVAQQGFPIGTNWGERVVTSVAVPATHINKQGVVCTVAKANVVAYYKVTTKGKVYVDDAKLLFYSAR